MASWKRYFSPVQDNIESRIKQQSAGNFNVSGSVSGNFSSYLPQVYTGPTNRLERYNQYDRMDLDSHVSASLDMIAEFCTQNDDSTGLPFEFNFKDTPTESQAKTLHTSLKRWVTINKFDSRLFDIIRNVIKYGDQFFIRDPETYEWLGVFQANIEKVLVNEGKGKKPEYYYVRDLDYNQQALVATNVPGSYQGSYPAMPGPTNANIQHTSNSIGQQYGATGRFQKSPTSSPVYAQHVVHLSMNNGMDPNWPFGSSILEKIFKTFKQKELLEDSIIIYRVQRAPERRIFYIDVGDLPENKAMKFVERMKNEIHQRRIPSKTGGGSSIMDASYNPLSILEDFFFPQRPDGRGSRVETLPGGDTTWGIDELLYFDNKLARGLRVPSSYLPTGPEDSPNTYNDGRVGTALIQELRFAKYCERIQQTIAEIFDREFKLYLKRQGINISSNIFDIKFVAPQNYATWRQIEIYAAKLNNFSQAVNSPYISKRLAIKEFLGWDEDKIQRNTSMIVEENKSKFSDNTVQKYLDSDQDAPGLADLGINRSDLESPETADTEISGEPGSPQEPESPEEL